MQCRLLLDMECDPTEEYPEGVKPKGTVIDHPSAYMLVEMGCAEPADEECAAAAPTNEEQLASRLDAYMMMEKGVAPEDREAWRKGWMRGYNPDGSWVPGPNADDYDEEEWEERKQNSQLILP